MVIKQETVSGSATHVAAKCPKCGRSPTQSIRQPIADPLSLYCSNCDHRWDATSDERARIVTLASQL
jgi:hypothetical protein